jgi:hypothetical protein
MLGLTKLTSPCPPKKRGRLNSCLDQPELPEDRMATPANTQSAHKLLLELNMQTCNLFCLSLVTTSFICCDRSDGDMPIRCVCIMPFWYCISYWVHFSLFSVFVMLVSKHIVLKQPSCSWIFREHTILLLTWRLKSFRHW